MYENIKKLYFQTVNPEGMKPRFILTEKLESNLSDVSKTFE